MAAPKFIKDPALSMADKVASTARAKQAVSAKSLGISTSDLAANPHLKQSKHFGADATPKNPMSKAYPENDGMVGQAKTMSKKFIGGM